MYNQDATIAKGYHPKTGLGMCTYGMRCYVNSASSTEEKAKRMQYFGFKRSLVQRAEHAFYHALSLAVPALRLSERVLDTSILAAMLGKRKSMSDRRPDYYHYFSGKKDEAFAILGEFDEKETHEDHDERLRVICDSTNAGFEHTYIFRVQGYMNTSSRPLCIRRTYKEHSYFELTKAGHVVVDKVAKALVQRIEWISQSLGPNDAQGRYQKMYF